MSVSRKDHTAIVSRASTLRVDKARFLLLAGALAAAGCSSSDSSNEGSAATTGAAGSSAGGGGNAGAVGKGGTAGATGGGGRASSGGAAGSSAGGGGRGGSAGTSGAGGSSGTGGSGGSKDGGVADSGMMEAGKTDAASDGSARDVQADGLDATSRETAGEAGCYDATGTPAPYCVGLPPNCTSLDTYCVSTREGMKSGVGQAFVACMQSLAGCSSPDAYACTRQALNGACSDATADSLCSTIEGVCSGVNAISSANCHKLVDGLNWWGRYRVQNCIVPPDGGADGGAPCQAGLWSCVEGI